MLSSVKKIIFLLLYVVCCLHGMFDEILLFCKLFMSVMTTKSLKLVKEMDHPGVFSLRVCKKIKNQNKKLGIGNLLTANPGVCFSFWRKPSQTQHWNVEWRNLDFRGRVTDNILNLIAIFFLKLVQCTLLVLIDFCPV